MAAPSPLPRLPKYSNDGAGAITDDPLLLSCAACARSLEHQNRCAGCQCVSYCNRACQGAHWKAAHKAHCARLAAENFVYIHGLAEAGNGAAALDAGFTLERGIGVAKRPAEALALYRRSAEAGCVQALTQLGHMLGNGAEGVRRDRAESAHFFLCAAEAGEADGALNFGLYCAYGKGTKVNGAAALRWLGAAIELEPHAAWVGNARYNMGRIHFAAIGGCPESPFDAERHFQAGAEAGHAESAEALVFLLGTGGEFGRGRKDMAAARKWAHRAVEPGADADKIAELLWTMDLGPGPSRRSAAAKR